MILRKFAPYLQTLTLIWADGGYQDQSWFDTILRQYNIRIEVIKRQDNKLGFVVLPRRWVVERTFAWLGRARRMSKDYEYLTCCSEGIAFTASIRLMLKRLSAFPPIAQ